MDEVDPVRSVPQRVSRRALLKHRYPMFKGLYYLTCSEKSCLGSTEEMSPRRVSNLHRQRKT